MAARAHRRNPDGDAQAYVIRDAIARIKPWAPGSGKFFISDVYDQVVADDRDDGMTIDEFKALLNQLRRSGQVDLARADLVAAMPQRKVALSEMDAGGATFHFIVVPELQQNPSRLTAKRSSTFRDDGIYNVFDGETLIAKLFRSPDDREWYEESLPGQPQTHYTDRWRGSSQAEALARIEARIEIRRGRENPARGPMTENEIQHGMEQELMYAAWDAAGMDQSKRPRAVPTAFRKATRDLVKLYLGMNEEKSLDALYQRARREGWEDNNQRPGAAGKHNFGQWLVDVAIGTSVVWMAVPQMGCFKIPTFWFTFDGDELTWEGEEHQRRRNPSDDTWVQFQHNGFTYRTNLDASIVEGRDGKSWNRTGSLAIRAKALEAITGRPRGNPIEEMLREPWGDNTTIVIERATHGYMGWLESSTGGRLPISFSRKPDTAREALELAKSFLRKVHGRSNPVRSTDDLEMDYNRWSAKLGEAAGITGARIRYGTETHDAWRAGKSPMQYARELARKTAAR